jgi:hypothetical protein
MVDDSWHCAVLAVGSTVPQYVHNLCARLPDVCPLEMKRTEDGSFLRILLCQETHVDLLL